MMAFKPLREEVLGVDPSTDLELTVQVGFNDGEPSAIFFLAGTPVCMLSILHLGQVFALFNELESTA